MCRPKGWQNAVAAGSYQAGSRLRLKCDGTCAETTLRLSAKRTSPLKSVGPGGGGGSSVDCWQANYTHQPAGFVLLVQACVLQSCAACWLPTTFSCFPFISPPVRHCVPSHFKRSLPQRLHWLLSAVKDSKYLYKRSPMTATYHESHRAC
jgi:hypothetical protein